MRVFKNRWFTRWAHRENVSDLVLRRTAEEVVAGRVEADLGGYLFKKRLARAARGKSTGYRIIVGYKRPNSERVIFLYAFAKNVKANISEKEREALSLVAEYFISATDAQVGLLVKEGSVQEVEYHE
jgi:hypothetical protein